MKKNLSLVVSFALLTSLTHGVNAANGWTSTKKIATVAGICIILGGGQYVEQLNKEYADQKKDPDLKLALAKSAAAAALLVGTDMLVNDHDTTQNLVKIGAFTIALMAGSDTVAHAVKRIPSVGAILTGPIVDDKEVKDSGAAARIIMAYVPLRQLGFDILRKGGSRQK
jgi:hypothetical protein